MTEDLAYLHSLEKDIEFLKSENKKISKLKYVIDRLLEDVVETDINSIIMQTCGTEDYEKLLTEISIKTVKYERFLEKLEKENTRIFK